MASKLLLLSLSLLGAFAQDVPTTGSASITAASQTQTSSSSAAPAQSSGIPAVLGHEGAPSLTSVLADHPELSMLTDLLQTNKFADLYDNLVNHFVGFSLLAPSNDALTEYLDTDTGKMFQNNASFANDVLEYHIVNGQLDSDSIPEGNFLSSMWNFTVLTVPNVNLSAPGSSGQYVGSVKQDGEISFLSGLMHNSTAQGEAIEFKRGYVYIIDKVLTLPSSLDETLIAGNFQALSGALEKSNIDSSTALTGDGQQFTLFAPINQAFLDIGSAVQNLSAADLTNVLKYHAHGEYALFADQLRDGMTVSTLQGNELHISIRNEDDEKRVFVNGARIVAPNIVTDQGVVHGIDEVLNPEIDSKAPQDADSGVLQFPGASAVSSLALTSGQPTPTSPIPLPAAATSVESSSGAGIPMATMGSSVGMLIAGAAIVAAM